MEVSIARPNRAPDRERDDQALVSALRTLMEQMEVPPRPTLADERDEQEASVIRACRTLTVMNLTYRVCRGSYAPQLQSLEREGYVAFGFEDRFQYVLDYATTGEEWSLTARALGKGMRSFFVDQCGVIRFSNNGPATADSEDL